MTPTSPINYGPIVPTPDTDFQKFVDVADLFTKSSRAVWYDKNGCLCNYGTLHHQLSSLSDFELNETREKINHLIMSRKELLHSLVKSDDFLTKHVQKHIQQIDRLGDENVTYFNATKKNLIELETDLIHKTKLRDKILIDYLHIHFKNEYWFHTRAAKIYGNLTPSLALTEKLVQSNSEGSLKEFKTGELSYLKRSGFEKVFCILRRQRLIVYTDQKVTYHIYY